MDTVGGYRLVRKLGAGERADIHLGHAGTREPPDGDRIAAIKVYRAGTDDASIDREIEALARASSRHLLELRDLATGPDGRPCLILPRLGSGTLGRLLAVRGTIAPGEAVSILAPLVEAVRELHRVGVAHGAVAQGSVLFDDRGAPILARFGAVSLFGEFPATDDGHSLTPARLDDDPAAIRDRAGVADLVTVVLDRLDGAADPGAISALREHLQTPGPPRGDLHHLVDLIWDLAPALPIRFDDDEVPHTSESLPGRAAAHGRGPAREPVTALLPILAQSTIAQSTPSQSTLAKSTLGKSTLAQVTQIETGDEHPFAVLRARAVAILAPVRTPVWIAGGAGLGALVIALTVIPAAHSEPMPGPSGSSQSPVSMSPAPISTAPISTAPISTAPITTAPVPPTPPDGPTTSGVRSAIEGEDPLAAARALLAARTRCFSAKSPTCFDSVDQAGSAVLEADRELYRRAKKGVPLPAEATLEGFTPRLIQQLGDSAIIQLVDAGGGVVTTKNPAPLLLVRSEAGWRIRDLALG